MPSLVTLAGIDEAIGNLNLREDTLKYRLIQSIRCHFSTEEQLTTIESIPVEELIRQIWETDDPKEIQQKRKNLSSLKSSLNKSLRQLGAQGLNPEGIVLDRNNAFTVSEEKKDSLIEQFGLSADWALSLKEAMSSVQVLFTKLVKQRGPGAVQELLAGLEQTKAYLEEIAEREQPAAPGGGTSENSSGDGGEIDPPGGSSLLPPDPGATQVLPEEAEIVEIAEEELAAPESPLAEMEEVEILEGEESEAWEEVVADDAPAAEGSEDAGLEGDATSLAEEGLDGEEIDVEEVVAEDWAETAGEGTPEDGGLGGPEDPAGEPVAEEEIEAEQVLFEDDIEEVELADVEDGMPAGGKAEGPQPGNGDPAGEPAPDADPPEAEQVVEADQIFDEDEIEVVEEPWEEGPALTEADDSRAEADYGPAAFEKLLAEDEIEEIKPAASEGGAPPQGENRAGAGGDTGNGAAGKVEAESLAADSNSSQPAPADQKVGPAASGTPSPSEPPKASATLSDQDTLGLMEALSELLGNNREESSSGATEFRAGTEPYLVRLISRLAPRSLAIPSGAYQVGSLEPQSRELPRRPVQLAAFRLGQFPVTNDLFELFVRETGYETEAEKRGYGLVYDGRFSNHTEPVSGRPVFGISRGTTIRQMDGADWQHPSGPDSTIQGRHRHPVVQVTLADALAFCRWAGKRLPSEEEWEVAAGAGDGRPYPWGRDWSPSRANVLASLWGTTTPVDDHGRDCASPFGVSDLIGNVYEWTTTVLSGTRRGGRGMIYVLKGGSWATGGRISIAHRMAEKEDHCSNIVGFRCAG